VAAIAEVGAVAVVQARAVEVGVGAGAATAEVGAVAVVWARAVEVGAVAAVVQA
jgi:hypothetical protein